MNEIYTIGHSTRILEELLALLKAYGIQTVIDIRTIPKSLKNRRIGYRHFKELGGLRHALKDSVNTGWINASFRGYADYMQLPPFKKDGKSLKRSL